jgi:hypothetical protein
MDGWMWNENENETRIKERSDRRGHLDQVSVRDNLLKPIAHKPKPWERRIHGPILHSIKIQ